MGSDWSEKLTKVQANVKEIKADLRDKGEQYFEDWATKEQRMREIQEERNFMAQTTAER